MIPLGGQVTVVKVNIAVIVYKIVFSQNPSFGKMKRESIVGLAYAGINDRQGNTQSRVAERVYGRYV